MHRDFYCDKVLCGKVAVDVVLETDHVLAFHHTAPSWPVHVVIVPKFHVRSLLEFVAERGDLLGEMMDVVARVVAEITERHGGCRLTTNFGCFQTSRHLHWHVYVESKAEA